MTNFCRTCQHCDVVVEIGDKWGESGPATIAEGICRLLPPVPVQVEYGFDGPAGTALQWRQPEIYPDKVRCSKWERRWWEPEHD